MNLNYVFRLRALIFFLQFAAVSHTVVTAQTSDLLTYTERNILNGNTYPALRELLIPELKKRTSPKEQLYFLNKLSRIDNILGNTLQSREWANQAELLIPQIHDSLLLYEHRLTMCEAKMSAAEFQGLLPELESIRKYCSSNHHRFLYKRVLTLLGSIYFLDNNYEQSKAHFNHALIIAQQLPSPYSTTIDKINITIPLFMQDKESATRKVLLHVDEAYREKDTLALTMGYLVLGQFYLQQQQTDKWEEILNKTIKLTANSKFTVVYQLVSHEILANHIAKKQYEDAVALGNMLLDDPRLNQLNSLSALHLDSLVYLAYLGTGDYKKALLHFQNYYSKSIRLKETSHLKELNYLQSKHEIQQKNLQLHKSRLLLQQQKKRFVVLLLSSLFVIALLSFLILFKSQKKRYTHQLFIKEREVEKLIQQENNKEAEQNDRSELYHAMIKLIEEERLFLNPQLDQKMLVSMLHTNKQYLYEAISQHQDSNFKHIINQYRVNEAKKLMEQYVSSGKTFSFDAIYLDSGFNSITSYYRAFKTFTGLTPKEYLYELQQELKENPMN